MTMKDSHTAQQKIESAIVLLRSKTASFIKTSELMTQSAARLVEKRPIPRSRPLPSPTIVGKRINVESVPPPTQKSSSKRGTLRAEGSLNNDE
jgi:hypothetical protein